MHRSRLSALMIDCSDATMDNGVQFWSQALGCAIRSTEGAGNPYAGLTDLSGPYSHPSKPSRQTICCSSPPRHPSFGKTLSPVTSAIPKAHQPET